VTKHRKGENHKQKLHSAKVEAKSAPSSRTGRELSRHPRLDALGGYSKKKTLHLWGDKPQRLTPTSWGKEKSQRGRDEYASSIGREVGDITANND